MKTLHSASMQVGVRFASALQRLLLRSRAHQLGVACLFLAMVAVLTFAATPPNGTLTDTSGPVTYVAGPFAIANTSSTVNGQVGAATPTCNPPSQPCDDFALTVNVSAATTSAQLMKIKVKWPTAAAQFDTYVLDSSGEIIGASLASNQGVDPDLLLLPAVSGSYTVRVVPYAPGGQSITATISLVNKTPASPTASGTPPRFQNYIASPGLGTNAGEPSVGCDWNPNVPTLKHGTVNTGGVTFFTSGPNELRTSFDDCSSPAKDFWEDISSPFVIQSELSDPIGFVDHQTGRVFQLDLIGGQGNSFAAFSDSDGNPTTTNPTGWMPMQGGGLPAGPDHETLGAGPYANFQNAVYPNAVYYCSQNIVGNAECSRSDDGGVSFAPGVIIFQDPTQCVGSIHGHVKVAPDGTVYVPNSSCGVGDASTDIAVSTDNGITWTNRTVPNSVGFGDPSIGIGQNNIGRPAGSASNTIYLGWVNGDGHPDIAASHDRGLTWGTTYDVGIPFGIKHSNFATVTAGDDNRAAFGFLGTPTDGNPEDPNFPGNWHFYIATTYDGGNTWSTIDATPNNPVQLGGICTLGFTCSGGDRNLLDFNDITVDSQGRMVAAYAAGCVAPGCNASSPVYASRNSKASILRQSGGRRMFAAFDPAEPALPGAPRLDSVTRLTTGNDLKWSAPDNGGSALTGYTIYRSTTSGSETMLTTVGPTVTEYLDTTANSGTDYFYQVSATNGIGQSPKCGELQVTGPPVPPRGPDSCNGVNVVIDPAGDATNPAAPHSAAGNLDTVDILGISFSLDATKTNLVTTMQLKNLSLVPINGTTSTAYNVVWQSSDGKIYASQATFPNANGTLAYLWGEYNPNTNQFVSSNTTTGSFVTGANGTVSVIVPLSGIGNPTIPITDPNTTAAVNNPYGLTLVGEGPVLGGAVFFIQPADRAPDSGFGQRWAVCPSTSGQATHYSISAPAGTTPGTAFNVTVTALDASGNAATSYRGTAHFASSDTKASLPTDYTFTSTDNGVHTFSVTLQTTGNQTITATDTSNASITATANVAVSTTTGADPCMSPTTLVITDPTGDQTGGQAGLNTQLDIQSVSVAENYHYIGHQNLVFTLKVANLNSIPPSSVWRVRWTFNGTIHYVAMNSDLNSLVTFDYGTQSGSLVTSVGGLDAGSFSSDGTITMVIGMSKVGGPTAGSSLTAISAVTQTFVGAAGSGAFFGIDDTSNGSSPTGFTYMLVGQSAACNPVQVISTINPIYVKGGMTFSPNFTVRAPYIGQDVEPGIRTDLLGNTYVGSIRGVPAGTDLWYFDLRPTIPDKNGNPIPNPNYDPNMRNPQYRGQPDGIQGGQEVTFGGDGGGDVAFAVGHGSPSPGAPPILAWTSLAVANVSAQQSTDKGVTFTQNPAGSVTGGAPVDDRQWIEFFGPNTVYLVYRTLEPAVTQIQQSIDGGLTYGSATTAGAIGQVGGIAVDQNDGTVYVSGSSGSVAVGIPPAAGLAPLTYTVHQAATGDIAHIFFTVKVASDGTVYVCYADDKNVFIKYSKDKGNTWSPPIRVSDGMDTQTSVFPWMETGAPGTIGVVWYGTNQPTNNDPDNWKVFYAIGTNVTTSTPTFQQAVASDHIIHAANISENGLVIGGQSPNRNLADYFQLSFDPLGAAAIAYTDDHNDFSGHTYVVRQISGPGVNGTSVPAPVEGSALPPPKPFSTDGSQVIDDRDDVRNGGNPQTGGLIVIHTDDPLDILSIKYTVEPPSSGSDPLIVARMKVSNLAVVPPSSNWRMNLTANAPMTQIAPPGDYDFGLSDRGDQFFFRASTDVTGTVQSFVYGTAVRNFDGSITYTDKGSADSGAFDTTNNTITVKVALSKLNAILNAAGHTPLGFGSVVAGLRGQTFTTVQGSTGNNRQDTARGGTQFVIDTPPTAVLTATPSSGFAPLLVTLDGSGSSSPDATIASYTFTFGDGSPSVAQSSPTIQHTYAIGTFTATLVVTDSFGVQSTNTASVTITSNNRPPTAVLKAAPTSGFAPLTVMFDGSSSFDQDGDSITSYTFTFGDGSASVTQSSSSTAHTYTGPGSYNATLTVTDSHGATSSPASVVITVMPPDEPPVVYDVSVTTNEDTPVTITLSATDPDSPSLTFSIVTSPSHGTLGPVSKSTCTANGSGSSCTATVTYTPATNYSGSDSFTYKANDGFKDSNVATVSITVTHVPEPAGKVTGGGEINVFKPDGTGNFGFNVKRQTVGGPVSGQLEYHNHARGVDVHSTSINALSISGNTATFTGNCTINNTQCTFSVTVQDNAEPGAGVDTFMISVPGQLSDGAGETISKGNIQIHKQ